MKPPISFGSRPPPAIINALSDYLQNHGYHTNHDRNFTDIYCIVCNDPISYIDHHVVMDDHLSITTPLRWGGTQANITKHQYNDPEFLSNIIQLLTKNHQKH